MNTPYLMPLKLLFILSAMLIPAYDAITAYADGPAPGTQASGSRTPGGITYADGALSVTAVNRPLGELLAEVASRTGIKVNLEDDVKTVPVSTSFTGLPLKDGLVRILEDAGLHDYLFVYKDRRKTTVSDIFVMKGDKKASGSVIPGQGAQGKQPASPFPSLPPTPMTPPQYPAVPPVFPPMPGEEPGADETVPPPVLPPFPPPEGDEGGPVPQPPALPGLPPGLP